MSNYTMTNTLTNDRFYTHNIESLYGQYFITTLPIETWYDWNEYNIDRYKLYCHKYLDVHNIINHEEKRIGFIVGTAIDPDTGVLNKDLLLDLSDKSISFDEHIENTIYRYGGRFVVIIITREIKRIYLDPSGAMGTVYSIEEPIAGSTTSLINFVLAKQNKKPMTFLVPPPVASNKYYPAGMTSDKFIHRCLPNHYLNLNDYSQVRHWPPKPIIRMEEEEVFGVAENVGNTIEKMIYWLVTNKGGVYCTLTAGRDSRVMLACSIDFVDRIKYFTFSYDKKRNKSKKRRRHKIRGVLHDVSQSIEIARHNKLNHTIIHIKNRTYQELRDNLYRIGYDTSTGKANDFYYGCLRELDLSKSLITGFAGAAASPIYWSYNDKYYDFLVPEDLLKRMGLPITENHIYFMSRWLDKNVSYDKYTLLDLLYIENRLGAWYGVNTYGTAPFRHNISPYNHRKVLNATLILPIKYKQSNQFRDDITRSKWPELLQYSYSHPGNRGLLHS